MPDWVRGYGATQFVIATKTFDGTPGKGAVGLVNLFTVRGQIFVDTIFAWAEVSLLGATATLSLGVSGIIDAFIAATVATLITTDRFWIDVTPVLKKVSIPSSLKDNAIFADIALNVAIAAITGGTLHVFMYYRPLSPNADVVPA